MRRLLGMVLGLLVCASASAQSIPLHDQPGCVRYVTEATPIDPGVTCHAQPVEAQGHWGDPTSGMPFTGDTSLLNPTVQHTHTGCLAPARGEVTGYMSFRCWTVAFHLAGYIERSYSELGTVIWDATGTTTAPFMLGDPMGVRRWDFTLVTDPNAYSLTIKECPYGWNPHGWTCIRVHATTDLQNGARHDSYLQIPFYSIKDLSVPEQNGGERRSPDFKAVISPGSPLDPGGHVWGDVIVQTYEPLPLFEPTSQPHTMSFLGAAYGQVAGGPTYTLSVQRDLDLHAGILGTTIGTPALGDLSGNAVLTVTIPASTSAAKYAAIYRADTGVGNSLFGPHEAVASLLVFTVSGGETGEPPPPPSPVQPWRVFPESGEVFQCVLPTVCGDLIIFWNPTGYRLLGPFVPF